MARKDVSTLRDEAAAAVEKGKLKQALELYGELERRQPKEASWPKRIGDVHRRLGDNGDAIAAYERAVEAFVQAGFAVQAIAVCKLILVIDGDHAPTLERLTKITENTSAVRPGAGRRKPVTLTPTRVRRANEVEAAAPGPAATIAHAAAAAADARPARPSPPRPQPSPPRAPPPPPSPSDEPAQIHAPVPRRSSVVATPVVLPPGTGLDGVALAFAATAGRIYSTGQVAQLDRAALADPTARGLRMEYRLISGNGDALADAKALGDERGKSVLGAKSAAPQGWPTDLVVQKTAAPAGFKLNPALTVPGVLAWSDPDDAIAVLRIFGAPAVLPPPLSGLYTVASRPVADLSGGGRLVRLVGGFLPTYAAIAQYEGFQVIGLGFSPEAATRALDRGRP